MQGPRIPPVMSKVLAFFGREAPRNAARILRSCPEEGCTVLALDVAAVGTAIASGVPFTVLDDWLSVEDLLRAKISAAHAEREWFATARAEFTADGICWPDLDHHALYYFWRDVLLAEAFAITCASRNVGLLRFWHGHAGEPALYYNPADICGSLWKGLLSTRVELRRVNSSNAMLRGARRLRQPLRHLAHRALCRPFSRCLRSGATQVALPAAGVVFALNEGEVHRFSPAIRELAATHPGMVSLALLSGNEKSAGTIAAALAVPVAPGPPATAPPRHLARQFLDGYAKVRRNSSGQPWEAALEHLASTFVSSCTRRWPTLALSLGHWVGLWRRTRPAVVVVSTLPDGESQLPAAAAKRCGVPSYAVPHGAGITRTYDQIAADRVLYDWRIHSRIYRLSGTPEDRMIPCRDLIASEEYPMRNLVLPAATTPARALVLTNPVGFPMHLAPSITMSAQRDALRTAASPPPRLRSLLSLAIKTHPHWPDRELFAAIDIAPNVQLLAPDVSLEDALRQTDFVIALNYCGGALIHAARAHKPIVFFWTDPLFGRTEPYRYADLYLAAGTVTRTPEELWEAARALVEDPLARNAALGRVGAFTRGNLIGEGYPTLGEILSAHLQ